MSQIPSSFKNFKSLKRGSVWELYLLLVCVCVCVRIAKINRLCEIYAESILVKYWPRLQRCICVPFVSQKVVIQWTRLLSSDHKHKCLFILPWFNLNPSMDKSLKPLKIWGEITYPSSIKLQQLHHWRLRMDIGYMKSSSDDVY